MCYRASGVALQLGPTPQLMFPRSYLEQSHDECESNEAAGLDSDEGDYPQPDAEDYPRRDCTCTWVYPMGIHECTCMYHVRIKLFREHGHTSGNEGGFCRTVIATGELQDKAYYAADRVPRSMVVPKIVPRSGSRVHCRCAARPATSRAILTRRLAHTVATSCTARCCSRRTSG